jgi:AbrB family looped-hinge helix DNA binding protein
MVVRVSSKGQLVIPKSIRDAMGIKPGTEVRVEVEGERIILSPINAEDPLDWLYGRFAETDLLSELEAEHEKEMRRDEALRA